MLTRGADEPQEDRRHQPMSMALAVKVLLTRLLQEPPAHGSVATSASSARSPVIMRQWGPDEAEITLITPMGVKIPIALTAERRRGPGARPGVEPGVGEPWPTHPELPGS